MGVAVFFFTLLLLMFFFFFFYSLLSFLLDLLDLCCVFHLFLVPLRCTEQVPCKVWVMVFGAVPFCTIGFGIVISLGSWPHGRLHTYSSFNPLIAHPFINVHMGCCAIELTNSSLNKWFRVSFFLPFFFWRWGMGAVGWTQGLTHGRHVVYCWSTS